jgi:uncharacterized membrane protein (UPF0127 family)
MPDGWVLDVGGRLTTPARLAATQRARTLGLLGSDPGPVLVLARTRSVHTFAMRYDLDVALCTKTGKVGALLVMAPNRVSRPRWGLCTIVEAPAGTFDRWGLRIGDALSLRPRP